MIEGLEADARGGDPEVRWQDLLEFEREWTGVGPAKDLAIRQRFGLSPARYHQRLNRLIEQPEALRYDPMLVRRLRRLREARRGRRNVRRLAVER